MISAKLAYGDAPMIKAQDQETSPAKAVVEELESFRAAIHQALESYTARMDSEISRISEAVQEGSGRKVSGAKLRDLRDMLTILRHAEVKTDKGRRKDLKKIDSLIADLSMLIENW